VLQPDSSFSTDKSFFGSGIECAACTRFSLHDTDVAGSVHVEGASGQAVAVVTSTIHGGLQVIRSEVDLALELSRSIVFGNVLFLENMTTSMFLMDRTLVGGNALLAGNTAALGFTLDENTVGQSLRFNRNTGASTLTANTITDTLACLGNDPPPTGAGNTAESATGQCASIRATSSQMAS
jgi:hypothetical protein